MEIKKVNIINKIKQVPAKPGCYFWKDYTSKIIYIGKAKNLRARLNQYMSKDVDDKTRIMISKAVDFDFILTKNEAESITTESNLIAKFKPKYNVSLLEQTNFNYLIITKEKYPRVFMSRFYDSKKPFHKIGPITEDVYKRRKLMEIINHYYPFRKCKKIPKSKCIYLDLNQCLGPCINKVEPSIYDSYVNNIIDFFKNKNNEFLNYLLKQEQKFATNLEFEKAKEIYDVINIIKEMPDLKNIGSNEFDVFSFYLKNEIITLSIFCYEENKLISKFSQTVFLKMETIESIVNKFIYEYYHEKIYKNKKLITSFEVSKEVLDLLNLKIIKAVQNQYVNIVQLAIENSKSIWKIDSLKLNQKFNRSEKALEDLKSLLQVDDLSLIEIYDNSHLFNDSPIGVKISFVNGEKRTNLYRKFNIRDLLKKSDADYMFEVISRRLESIYKKKSELIPNLLIVDGGKIQIKAAQMALKKYNLDSIIHIIGLAKNNKHQTEKIIFSNNQEMILDKKSDLFFLLSTMQEEVHRFAISSFRKKHQTNFYKNELNNINGVGNKTIKKLLDYFETIEQIKSASFVELEQIIGKKIANRIKDYFQKM